MKHWIILCALGVVFQSTLAVWTCNQDSDCSSLPGSICNNGSCVCKLGTQPVLGGTVCADLAPYHTSPCREDHQCFRLFNNYECLLGAGVDGICRCRPGHHYFHGRCWKTTDYGEPCNTDEECLPVLRDPYSLSCNGTCVCAEGYYMRQRGECRRAALAVGDGCVLNEDCQFSGGSCDITTLTCYNSYERKSNATNIPTSIDVGEIGGANTSTIQYGDACDTDNPCKEPLECSTFGVCICPIGYYNIGGNNCLAELGSPSTPEQCVGFLAVVIDGICTCPPNFYFEDNMRDCVRVTRRISDSCVTDENCHTFGASTRCGAPQAPWGIRNCECIPEYAVWDTRRDMCRLFAGIGESCEVDSDCMAGELEIQCVLNDVGEGLCTCPPDMEAEDGLCLTRGLELGDSCQVTAECTGTENTVCEDGRCSCDDGYQEDDGACAPVIGGSCIEDADCVIPNTVCLNETGLLTCQCDGGFVEFEDVCLPISSGFEDSCNITDQCIPSLGNAAICQNGTCACKQQNHYKDGGCWPKTGLFEECSRSSECYLSDKTDRVVCRNSMCQCDFNFPYSEEHHTCLSSSATAVATGVLTVALSLAYIISS